MNIPGKEIIRSSEEEAVVRVMAGENWHGLVLWTIEQGLGGIENLALIPGKSGTAPIQNIGAYGVELKDVFEACEALEISTGKIRRFTGAQCRFGYRDSYFKGEGKGKYIIVALELRLTKKHHRLSTSYGAIGQELDAMEITEPAPGDIAGAVIAIRERKLPNPALIGNSGSFFKNPVIDRGRFESIRLRFPDLPGYPQKNETQVKVPAGWLIEQCGFKGYRRGDAGVHANQALVLVNYGRASGQEILQLARSIQQAVREKFSIELQPEVNIL
jgi:UDP-N-acetylmuramate dehydrogenase